MATGASIYRTNGWWWCRYCDGSIIAVIVETLNKNAIDGPKLGSCRNDIVANKTEAVHQYSALIGPLDIMTIVIECVMNQVFTSVLILHD